MDQPKSPIEKLSDAHRTVATNAGNPGECTMWGELYNDVKQAYCAASEACGRTLTRIEQDPHLSYLIGDGSETRVLLLKAFAELSGKSIADVERQFPTHAAPLNPRVHLGPDRSGEVLACSERSTVGLIDLLQALDRECFLAHGRMATCDERQVLEAVWTRAEQEMQ